MNTAYSCPRVVLLLICALWAGAVLAQAPPNDTRATALPLSVGEVGICVATAGSLLRATASGTNPSCRATNPEPLVDLWYYFVATQPNMTVGSYITSGTSSAIAIEATAADGASVGCDLFNYSRNNLRLSGLAAGDTVYVQIAQTVRNRTNGFEVCAYESPDCLPVENVSTRNGQTWAQVLFFPNPGVERYRVVVGPRRRFNPATDTPVAEAFGTRSGIIVWGLTPGEAYDFYVQALCSDEDRSPFVGPRQLFSQAPAGTPENDSLRAGRGATIIPSVSSGCFGTPGSTRFSTPGDGPVGDCGPSAPLDVWYELNPVDPYYRLVLEPAPGETADLAVEVYDNASGARLACANDVSGAGAESVELRGLVERQRLNIRVFAVDPGAVADFTICAFRANPPVAQAEGCLTAPAVTFDGSGSAGELVDILTASGGILLSVENTQNLGAVTASYYGHAGDLRREPSSGVRYADRNLAVVPTTQPTSPLLVRLYLSRVDLINLASSGVLAPYSFLDFSDTAAQQIDVVKVPRAVCSQVFPSGGAQRVTYVGSGRYGQEALYVDVRVSSFSEFFFSGIDDPLPADPVGVRDARRTEPFAVWPNPARGSVQVAFPQNHSSEAANLEVFDVMGRRVLTHRLPAGQQKVELDVSVLPKGVYTLRTYDTAREVWLVARLLVEE